MNSQIDDREAGMSLVEVVFASVLVVTFLGALLTVAVRQGVHRQVNSETSLAMTAALDNLERIRSVPFATLPALNGSGFDVPGLNGEPGGLQPLPNDPDDLPGEITVLEDQIGPGTKLYRVRATVLWQGASRVRRLQVDTLMAERK
jgi:hypothetical protein